MIKLPELTTPAGFLLFSIIFFIIIAGRYFFVSGIFYGIFYVWYPEKWKARKLSSRKYPQQQFKKEIKWSLITSLLFSCMGVVTLILWQEGYTRVYTDVTAYGWFYLPVSLFLSLGVQETYYYWVHRWMHRPAIFRVIHKVHHESNITSPFTAFSFHPIEGLLQALILPLSLLIIPMHPTVILIQLVIMSLSSVINHLNIELYSHGFNKSLLGKWLVGATHHSLHHSQFKYNYGLYFTIWDKWKKTESPAYTKTINDVSSREHE